MIIFTVINMDLKINMNLKNLNNLINILYIITSLNKSKFGKRNFSFKILS
jgi:hypothetical protein